MIKNKLLKEVNKKMMPTDEELVQLESELKELESKSNDDDAEYNTSPYPKSERDINLSIIYSKLKFYFKNKISIKFRLIERLEYQFEGKLIEVERNKFTIQLEKDKAIFRCLDVDHTTICPKSYDPFMKGIRIEIPEELRERIFKRDNYICKYNFDKDCSYGKDLTIDHIKPIYSGGTNDESNLITACRHCNSKKGTKNVGELFS